MILCIYGESKLSEQIKGEKTVKSLKLKIGDIILIIMISVTAVLLFILPLLSDSSMIAEIVIMETEEKHIVMLDKEEEYTIVSNDIILKICVKNGEIYVSESTCRDKICLKTPPISHAGQTIVCAPGGIVIRIPGEEAIVDGVSQ